MAYQRHCERSEAIQLRRSDNESWIASSQVLPCANASRLSQAMTVRPFGFTFQTARGCASAFPRRDASGVCVTFHPPKHQEGAGKAGCALHPRSRVQNLHKKTHTSIQVQRRHPAFPAQWVTAYFVLSPVSRALLPPSPLRNLFPGTWRQLRAPGPHGFAVRQARVRLAQASRPPHPTARS